MKYFTRGFFVFFLIGLQQSLLFGQSKARFAKLEVGKPCPDVLFKNIQYYSKTRASLKDFRGKWLVLDFWSSGCTSCVAAFPHVNEMQKKFKDAVQFLLVAQDDKYVRPMYEKFRVKENLQLPIIFDTVLWKYFDIYLVPYVVVLDDKGICRAIVGGLKEQNMTDLIAHKNPDITPAYTRTQWAEKNIDYDKLLLIDGNGGQETDFTYRSIFYPFKPGSSRSGGMEFGPKLVNTMQFWGVSIERLYKVAYYDTLPLEPLAFEHNCYSNWVYHPILEITDTLSYNPGSDSDKNLFCYSVTVPPEKLTRKFMQETIQRDLQTYFGYHVRIEKRVMPYWRLVAKEGAAEKLKTKGGKTERLHKGMGQDGIAYNNSPVYRIIQSLWYYHQLEPAFVDETGITGNIDFKLDCLMTDLNDIKRALQQIGLDLEKGEKEMKVLIISDPDNNGKSVSSLTSTSK